LGVGCSALGVRCLSPPFLPITDLILSAFLPLQHSNTPTLQPSPLPAPRSFATPTRFCPPSTFDVPCSVFGVRCLSLSSLPFTDHGSPITFVSFAPSSLPRRVRQTFYAAPHSPPAFDVRRSVFGVRCSALGVGRWAFDVYFSSFRRHRSSNPLFRPRFAALLFHDKIAMLARPFPPCRTSKPII
jgi:hypothetical protein